jgi:hypothetical protein
MRYKPSLLIGVVMALVAVTSSYYLATDVTTERELNTTSGYEKTSLADLHDANQSEPDQRYINKYHHAESKWIPENKINISLNNPETGAYEITQYPNSEPSEENINSSWKLYNKSYEVAKERGWFKFETGIDDGFVKGNGPHYVNPHYLFDDQSLNAHRPEHLIYYDKPNGEGKILAGYMYHKKLGSKEGGEQIGGPLTVWHYHPMKFERYSERIREFVSERERFENTREFFDYFGTEFETADGFSEKRDRTAEMLHVWFIRNPDGPFGTKMSIPEQYLKEPEKMSKREFRRYAIKTQRNYSVHD